KPSRCFRRWTNVSCRGLRRASTCRTRLRFKHAGCFYKRCNGAGDLGPFGRARLPRSSSVRGAVAAHTLERYKPPLLRGAAATRRVHVMAYKLSKVPAGDAMRLRDGKLEIPDRPILPFIEGDGTGPDIWRASVHVFDATVKKVYGGKRQIAWMEVYAGEKAFKQFNS